MKSKKFNNFELKGNGELEFFDEDIEVEEWYNRKEICIKLKSYHLRVMELYKSDYKDERMLSYLDKNLDAVIGNKQLLSKAFEIISDHTDYYGQMEDNFRDDF